MLNLITSSHNSTLKLVRALARDAKERREEGLFIVEGFRLVKDLLASNFVIEKILVSSNPSNKTRQLTNGIDPENYSLEEVESRIFEQISSTENSQGILAIARLPEPEVQKMPDLILIPDQIRNPGNLGTLIRSAVAAGAGLVLIPPETTDPFSPKALRSGMGAHFVIPIISEDWNEIKTLANDHQVLIATSEGEQTIWDVDLRPRTIVIIGGEAEGASKPAEELASLRVKIPMKGKIESLNAGIAGSIILYEALRQRSSVK
ncbi:MAG TPA: RNA methyltransferase [Anaerolineales bacterium]|nr:RNA methyltransferase [Anaerolineales bacterium]